MTEIYDWEQEGSLIYDWERALRSERAGLREGSTVYRVMGKGICLLAIAVAAKADINLLHHANDVQQSGQVGDLAELGVASLLAWTGLNAGAASSQLARQAEGLV